MTTRRTLFAATALIGAATAAFAPAFAASAHRTPKPLHGTFSYVDTTPDPTVVANTDAASHCHGNLPSSPADVNSHTIKVTGPGTLSVVGHNKLDWAMEVRDSHGVVLAGSDGSSPAAPEGAVVTLPKAGTYAIVYCSAEGEPTITADYTYKYR
jgi:hypothetical protein